MKIHDLLLEHATKISVVLLRGSEPEDMTIWINPRRPELNRAIALSEMQELRGILSPKRLVVWDAYMLEHASMEHFLDQNGLDEKEGPWAYLSIRNTPPPNPFQVMEERNGVYWETGNPQQTQMVQRSPLWAAAVGAS